MREVEMVKEVFKKINTIKDILSREIKIISSMTDDEKVVKSVSNIKKSLGLINSIDAGLAIDLDNFIESYFQPNYNIHSYKDEVCDIRMDKVESGWLLHFRYKKNGSKLPSVNKVFDSDHKCLLEYAAFYSAVKSGQIEESLSSILT